MYKVELHPKRCPHKEGWVARYSEGEIIEVADNQFKIHERDGCMTPLEHYRLITVNKKRCPKCGQPVTKRTKVIL